MPQNQLILHVGFHKSGTSALQEALFAQRAELRAKGIWYPDIGRKAHHRIAWSLTQKPWGWKARGGEVTPFGEFTTLIRKINGSKDQKVLLSSEFFSELTAEQINKISLAVRNREVIVLFTLRPLVKVLASSYQQYLKYGTKADYVEWLHSVLDEPGVSKVNPSFWRRHMHGQVIGRWAEAFGASAVTVLIADETKPEVLFDSVNEFLGLEMGFIKTQSSGGNRSLSLEEIALLLQLNRTFPAKRQWSEYLLFIRNGYIRQLTDSVPIKEGKEKLLTPSWAIDKANGVASESKKKIQELGVRVVGDIDSLDTATVPEGEPTYPTSIDIETVASSMLGFKKNITRKIPNSWYREELLSRIKIRLGLRKSKD